MSGRSEGAGLEWIKQPVRCFSQYYFDTTARESRWRLELREFETQQTRTLCDRARRITVGYATRSV